MRPPRRDSGFWFFAYWASGLLALTTILWITATQFDHTEHQTIVCTGSATAVLYAVVNMMRNRFGSRD